MKREADELHFRIHEEIEKFRPKRNGSVDIKKCIAVCEEGKDNLPAFIQEDYDDAYNHHLRLKELGIEREFVSPIAP